MIYVSYSASLILVICVMIGVPKLIRGAREASWRLWFIGVATFILSQVGHIPFNWFITNRLQLLPTDTTITRNVIILAIFLGLSAGVFEEVTRYLVFRFWAKDARSWGTGLMVGAGHGAIEAVLFYLLPVGLNFIILGLIHTGFLPVEQLSSQPLTANDLALLNNQLKAMFDIAWYMPFAGSIERLFAMTAHLAMSLLVLQVFLRGQKRWLGIAILWHASFNGVAVAVLLLTQNTFLTEAVIALFALLSLGIIFYLKTPEPQEPDPEPLPQISLDDYKSDTVEADKLSESMYT